MEKRQNEVIEIDLLELFYALKKQILWIILAAIVGGTLAFAGTKLLMTPMYESTTTMLVLTKETTLSSLADLQMGSQLTKDYSILITSRPVLTDVIDQLDLDMDYKQLKNMITVTNQDDTRILQLSVEYSDAKQAKEIVDKLSEVASEYIGDKMEVTPPKIIEKGEVPTSRSNTGVAKMAVMGVLAGMILCAGVIVIRTIMDDTIKSEEDIEKYLGLSTLSVIPDRKDYINGSGKKKSKRNDAGKRKAS